MKKSIFLIMTLLFIAVSLAGCNSNSTTEESNRLYILEDMAMEMVLEETKNTPVQKFRSTNGIEFEVSKNYYCYVEDQRVLYTKTDELRERMFEDDFVESEMDLTLSSTNEILSIEYYTLKWDNYFQHYETVRFAVENVKSNSIVIPNEIPTESNKSTFVSEFIIYIKDNEGAIHSLLFVLNGM